MHRLDRALGFMFCVATTAMTATITAACGGGGRDDAEAGQSGTSTVGPGGPTTVDPSVPTTSGMTATASTGDLPTGSGSDSMTGTSEGTTATTMAVDPKFDVGGQPDLGGGGCGGGMGDVEFSYIWVANSAQGTISKINTQTLVEEGRYIVRPDSAGSPSRTSVNLSGDVAVANRLGGVAKVYARTEDCQESNGMPGIQTSTGAADILPWGVEECLAWYTPMNYTTQRPLAWSSGELNPVTCKYEDQKAWTAAAQSGVGGSIVVSVLSGETGAVEMEVPIPEVPIGFYGAYGAAFDPEGNFWFVDSGNDGPGQELVRVRGDDYSHQIWSIPPEIYSYGFTVDTKGRPWIAGYQGGVARFDPITETFAVNAAVTGLGIQEDAMGRMWMAVYPWNAPNSIVALDRDSLALIKTINLPEANLVKGISIDFYGKVWAVDQGTSAFRIDPVTDLYDIYSGLTGPYTYSDMTGWGLSNVTNPQG